MKILLFGGTFDPPHVGHMNLLKSAIEKVKPDHILVIPTGQAPHKDASATAAKYRIEMCSCFKKYPNVIVSQMEIEQQGKSYTWKTVQQVMQMYPDATIYLTIGSDMLHSFTKWYAFEELLKNVTLVAQDRLDTDVEKSRLEAEKLRDMGGKVIFTDGRITPLSSTYIRLMIEREKDITALLPAEVISVIQKNNLYAACPK